MIHLDSVTLTLPSRAGPVHILKGIDLDVGAGDTVSVVGPSGSGKSSMLMLIGGLERPTGGTLRVAGRDLADLDEDDLARFRCDNVGIVFQDFHLIPTMTALENVALPLEFGRRRNAFDSAAEALAQVGLADRLSHYPGQLSGGEVQRVALARAIAPRPPLVMADEPTGNLDSTTGERVMDLLFGLCRDRGATLLLITHDSRLADRCARQVELVDGRIAGERRPDADVRVTA